MIGVTGSQEIHLIVSSPFVAVDMLRSLPCAWQAIELGVCKSSSGELAAHLPHNMCRAATAKMASLSMTLNGMERLIDIRSYRIRTPMCNGKKACQRKRVRVGLIHAGVCDQHEDTCCQHVYGTKPPELQCRNHQEV